MTTTSERRAAVAQAISDALPAYMQARGALDPTGTPGHWWPNGAGTLALTDAALAAALPDKQAFAAALTEVIACAMEWGVFESQGHIDADTHEANTNAAAAVVRRVVYGTEATE